MKRSPTTAAEGQYKMSRSAFLCSYPALDFPNWTMTHASLFNWRCTGLVYTKSSSLLHFFFCFWRALQNVHDRRTQGPRDRARWEKPIGPKKPMGLGHAAPPSLNLYFSLLLLCLCSFHSSLLQLPAPAPEGSEKKKLTQVSQPIKSTLWTGVLFCTRTPGS